MAILSVASALFCVLGIAFAYKCQNISVPLSVSARNGVFKLSTPQSNIEVTNFILDSVKQGHNGTAEILTGYTDTSGTYSIQATFCQPDRPRGRPSQAIQILTHGIGFDRSYWDLQYHYPDYSYIKSAVDRYGYNTLSYDRLGIGQSQHGDPVKEIQAPLQQAVLIALTQKLREGTLQGVSQSFNKVIHVGHSFGSILSYALARDMPDISDALVLTGYAANGTFLPSFLIGGNWVSATTASLPSQYEAGYFAAGSPSGVQTNHFAPAHFDNNILSFAYASAQPVSVGEILTIGGIGAGASSFSKPVMIITGERDFPFCGGDCSETGGAGPSIPEVGAEVFSNTKPNVTIVPGAGHALNMGQSKSEVFTTINEWLSSEGFGYDEKR